MRENVELPSLLFEHPAQWERWLEENHADSAGIWMRFGRKGSGLRSITHAEALEIALQFGWIDGQSKSLDAESWAQKFIPRGKKSIWSKVNRAKAEELIAQGQ